MKKTISVQLALAPNTHKRIIDFAKHIDCVSRTGNPKAATAVKKTLRVILTFYTDYDFQECLENEGIDTLAFIQKCVKKGIQDTLKQKNIDV